MPVEMLTYAELGERLKISPEAARALVKRHRWPRTRANDSKTLVQVDLTEINHSPISRQPQATGRSPGGHRPEAENRDPAGRTDRGRRPLPAAIALTSRRMRTHEQAPGRTAQVHLGKHRCRGKAALLEGKLSMLTQPWRRRLVDAFTLALPQVACNAPESAGSVAQSRN